MSKISTLASLAPVIQAVGAPLVEAATNSALNKIKQLADTKSFNPRSAISQLRDTASQRTKAPLVYFGPGGSGLATANLPPNYRRRGRRRGRRGRRRGGPGVRAAPVSFDTPMGSTEASFQTSRINSNQHGPGIACAFTTFLCNAECNGVSTANDRNLPFDKGTMFDSTHMPSGFISADTLKVSGINLHPGFLGPRMNREVSNWGRYRWRWFKIRYVAICPTSASGSFTMAFTRDPAQFIEATGTQASPSQSFVNLSQSAPWCTGNNWSDKALMVTNRENILLPCEYSTYTSGNDLATVAYNRGSFFGRLAGFFQGATTAILGQMWMEGVIEFYNPSSTLLSVGTTYADASFSKKPMVHSISHHKWFVNAQLMHEEVSDPFLQTVTSDVKDEMKGDTSQDKSSKLTSWEDDEVDSSSPVGTLKTTTSRKIIRFDSRGVSPGRT
jgi:hypothetical protein